MAEVDSQSKDEVLLIDFENSPPSSPAPTTPSQVADTTPLVSDVTSAMISSTLQSTGQQQQEDGTLRPEAHFIPSPQAQSTPPPQAQSTPPPQAHTTPPTQAQSTPPPQAHTTPPPQAQSTPPSQAQTTRPSKPKSAPSPKPQRPPPPKVKPRIEQKGPTTHPPLTHTVSDSSVHTQQQVLKNVGSNVSVDKASLSSWTEIDYPVVPKECSHLVPPESSEATKPKQLCGYLGSLETHKLRKTWKNRWFRLDEYLGKLFYYEDKTSLIPLGFIDLSNVSLSCDVEHLNNGRFSIATPVTTHHLQAQNKDAMRYWLDQLQKKRKNILLRSEHQNSDSTDPHLGSMATEDPSGLVGEELDTTLAANDRLDVSDEDDRVPDSVALDKPVPVENKRNLLHSIKRSLPVGRPMPRSHTTEGSFKFYLSSSQEMHPNVSVDGPPKLVTESARFSPGGKRKVSFPRSFRRQVASECPKCAEMKLELTSLHMELKEKDQEVRDRDEICEFLRGEIRRHDNRQKVQEAMINNDAKSLLDNMAGKEEELSELKRKLENEQYEKELTEKKVEKLERAECNLEEQLAMYRETVKAKDDVVIQLTNEIYLLKNKGQIPDDPREALFPVSTTDLEKEVDKLKESVEAYREINMFLSKEVSSLQELRSADSARMLELTDNTVQMEAEITRLKSKLVALLNEQDAPMLMSGSETVMQEQEVSMLLREAMESGTLMTPEADPKPTSEKKEVTVDDFGFKSKADSDMSVSLQSFEKIDFKEVQHIPPYSPQQRRDALTQEWVRFLRNHGNIESDLPRTEELKNLIRKGIPVPKYRAQVWRACIKDLLKKKNQSYLADGYKALLETHAGNTSPALGQIELDLLRTLPNNVYFDNPEAKGILKLRRILVAYSWYNPEVGYCQGLNRLAAIALLFLDEEWAFWCLVAIVQCIQPSGYYTKNLVGSQADQRVLQQIMSQKAPRVAGHLSACNIDYSLITFNWFLTIFVDNMPPETMIRIWDSFLYEGSKVLFRYAIAIFKYHEDDLLHYHDPIKLYSFLRKMSLRAVDVDRLSHIAFNELNPFPMKKIIELRLRYQPELQIEVENLERIRVAHVAKVQEKISQITTSRLESEDIESPVEAPSDVEEEENID